LLGFVAFVDGFGDRLLTPTPDRWAGEYADPALTTPAPARAAVELVHFGPSVLIPLACLALGVLAAWWAWRRAPAAAPARVLGPARPSFANAFYLDTVQDALVVRPAWALARAVRRGDESVVDGVVEGTGRGTLGLGGRLAAAHRAALPSAATAVLAGALLIGLAAITFGGVW